VQAWCYKYSTCPLRPSRLWLQEASIRCLHRVFLRAKPKAAYMLASLPQPGGDVEQPISLCVNMISSIKPEIRNISLCCQRRTEPRPQVTSTKNLVKIRRVVVEIWSRTDTHRQTCSSQYSALPIAGGVMTDWPFCQPACCRQAVLSAELQDQFSSQTKWHHRLYHIAQQWHV